MNEEWAQQIGASVRDWPAFPDSAAALAEHYELVILSNVHLQGDYATVISAEDVGPYEPASKHFDALEK